MPVQTRLLDTPHDRALQLGPRQLQIMRAFWTHGPGTVQDLRDRLDAEPLPTYTMVMSLCVRLYEKGLLTRRSLSEARNGRGVPFIYAAALSETEYPAGRLAIRSSGTSAMPMRTTKTWTRSCLSRKSWLSRLRHRQR